MILFSTPAGETRKCYVSSLHSLNAVKMMLKNVFTLNYLKIGAKLTFFHARGIRQLSKPLVMPSLVPRLSPQLWEEERAWERG